MTGAPSAPHFDVVGQTGYAFGNFGKSVLWSTTEYFLLFYLTELLGLPPIQAGLLIFFSLVLDAALGPFVGFAADRTASPLGKYGPYLIFGAPFVALAFWLLFAFSRSDSAPGFVEVAVLLFVFRIAYVICDVPHNALMARISATARDASTISGLRFLFSSVGALIAATVAGAALAAWNAEGRSETVSLAAAGAGLAFLAAMWVSAAATNGLDRALPNRAADVRCGEAVRLVIANPALGALLVLALVQVGTLPLFAKGLAYWGATRHGDPGWSGEALGIIAVAQGLSMLCWIPLGRRWSPIQLASGAYAVVGLSAICFLCAIVFDASAAETATLVVYGIGHGGAVTALWALLPGAIAAGGVAGGSEMESLPTGVFLFVIKAGAGLGTAALGAVLGWIGLGEVPAPHFEERLAVLMFGALAVATIACFAAARHVGSGFRYRQ